MDQYGSIWIVMIVAPSPDPSRHQRWFQKLSSWVAIGPPSRSEERSVAAWCIRDTLMIVCCIVSPTFLHLGMHQLIILNSLPLAWLAPQLTKKNISKGEQLLSWQVKHSSIDGIAMSVAQVARALWAHQKLAAPSSTKPEKERGRVDVAIASACLSKKWWVVMGLHSCIEPCVFVWICWIVWTGLNRSNRDCSSKIRKYCTRHQTRHFLGVMCLVILIIYLQLAAVQLSWDVVRLFEISTAWSPVARRSWRQGVGKPAAKGVNKSIKKT